ncbi:MAG TPA: cell wall protein [Micromonosporaceae bacterium]
MNRLDRRRFLTAAVLGAGGAIAGASALGVVDPDAAFAAEPIKLDPGVKDPNFAEGRITGINGTTLMVTGSDNVLYRIMVTEATSIWKLTPTDFNAIAVGDGLYARGVPLVDGALAAEAVWVNIVNLHGTIRSMGRNWMHMDHHGQTIVAHVVPGTSAAVYNHTPAVPDFSQVTVGQHVHILGAWIPDTNEINIATLYASV